MVYHPELAAGRWQTLSLAEQMGHIGSEVSRALSRQRRGTKQEGREIERAFELIDLTLEDPRWRHRLKELVRVREVLADAVLGGQEYGSRLSDLDRYFFHFAKAARRGHEASPPKDNRLCESGGMADAPDLGSGG